MMDSQFSLPGLGRRYPSVPGARALGPKRYRQHLVFLACMELRAEAERVSGRTQDALRARTVDIHRRHFPRERWYAGVPERTMRRDKRCSALHRRLRGLEVRRLPKDLTLKHESPKVVLGILARTEECLSASKEECEALKAQNAVLRARLCQFENQFRPRAGPEKELL